MICIQTGQEVIFLPTARSQTIRETLAVGDSQYRQGQVTREVLCLLCKEVDTQSRSKQANQTLILIVVTHV